MNILFKNKYIYLFILLLALPAVSPAQDQLIKSLEDSLTMLGKKYASVGTVKIKKITPDLNRKILTITTNEALSYLPLRSDNVDSIYSMVRKIVTQTYPDYSVSIFSDNREVKDLVPGYYRKSGKSPINRFKVAPAPYPLVRNLSQPFRITN